MKSSVGAVLEEDVDDTYKGGPPTEKWGAAWVYNSPPHWREKPKASYSCAYTK